MTLVSDLLEATESSQRLRRQKHAPMLEVIFAREVLVCPALAGPSSLTQPTFFERRRHLAFKAPRRDVLDLAIRSL